MKKPFVKNFLLFILVYFILALLFFWIVKDDWRRTTVSTDAVNRDVVLPELTAGSEIRQDFIAATDHLKKLKLLYDSCLFQSLDMNSRC